MRIGGSGVDAVRNPRTFVRADWKDGVTTRGKFEGDVEAHRSAHGQPQRTQFLGSL
ncbi:MAG: hypothetical protein WA694_01615 [Pseudolabrys sp.]